MILNQFVKFLKRNGTLCDTARTPFVYRDAAIIPNTEMIELLKGKARLERMKTSWRMWGALLEDNEFTPDYDHISDAHVNDYAAIVGIAELTRGSNDIVNFTGILQNTTESAVIINAIIIYLYVENISPSMTFYVCLNRMEPMTLQPGEQIRASYKLSF